MSVHLGREASQKVIVPVPVSGALFAVTAAVSVTSAGEATAADERVSVVVVGAGGNASATRGNTPNAVSSAETVRAEAVRLEAEENTFNMPEFLGSCSVVK
jgi:hypothetical protein